MHDLEGGEDDGDVENDSDDSLFKNESDGEVNGNEGYLFSHEDDVSSDFDIAT